MKYYVMPKNAVGEMTVLKDSPKNIEGVTIIDLPAGAYLTVISKGKEFPAEKVARAIACGQIKIEDVK